MLGRHLQRTLRGRNILLNIFEMWVALAGIISGAIFFYSPASIYKNALALVVGHVFAGIWSVSYFTAGAVIMWGLLRPSPRWEVAGLYLLGGATGINGIAITSVFGLRGTASSLTLLTLTAASWLRASFVMRTAIRLAEENDGLPRR